MTTAKAGDESKAEKDTAPESQTVENENGLVLSMACPNAYVVGVEIVEGQAPPEGEPAEAEG